MVVGKWGVYMQNGERGGEIFLSPYYTIDLQEARGSTTIWSNL